MKQIISVLVFAFVTCNAISQSSNLKIYEDWVNNNLLELNELEFGRIDKIDVSLRPTTPCKTNQEAL